MLGSVVHVVTSDPAGTKHSAVLGSKSALHSGTVPRNEKLSLIQAAACLTAVVRSLDQEWTDNQVAWILGDRSVHHHTLTLHSHSLSHSTIASYLFAGELYTGDGHSRIHIYTTL